MEFKNISYSNKLLGELTKLRKFGNELMKSTSTISFRNINEEISNKSFIEKEKNINDSFKNVLNVVIEEAFKIIDRELQPQVISIFLFAKSGYLERYKIYSNNIKDLDKFLPTEQYRKGESFSGKSADGDPYGEPYLSNNLDLEKDKLTHGIDYETELGFLKCGITVPLDSTHRTFGTLEVINKVNPKTKLPDPNFLYSEIEVFWLTVLGGHLARSISRIRKKQEEFVIAEITKLLVESDPKYNSDQVFQTIVNQLVSNLTPYKACILRFLEGRCFLLVAKTASTKDIDMNAKKNSTRKLGGDSMVASTCETKKFIIRHVDERPEEFKSRPWMVSQGLESFICFPLLVGEEVVGTLSLFTGYKHYFNDSDLDFLTNISNLLAAYKVGLNKKKIQTKHNDNEENNDSRQYLKDQFLLFQENLPNLRKKYLNKYVHFHNGEVKDSDENEIALLKRIYSNVDNNPQEVFVEQVTHDDLSSEMWDYLPLQ